MANIKTSGRLWLVAITVLCGLAAGFFGGSLVRWLPEEYAGVSYLGGDVNLSDLNGGRSNLVIRDPKKVVVNQDVKVDETLNSIRPAIVGVFKAINQVGTSTDAYYKMDAPLFTGLMMTSDGWVSASLPNDLKASFAPQKFVAVSNERKIYQIDKIADFKNLSGDIVFFHLSGAANLPVKKIVPRSELGLGQSVIVVSGFNNVLLSSLSSFRKTPEVLSSDSLNAEIGLAGDLKNNFQNSFVFNLAGDLVAVINSNQVVSPAFSLDPYWRGLLKGSAPVRPYLGVSYLDLSATRMLAINLEKGAYIYSAAKDGAVAKNSPAALAGLKSGDVITWVNNQEINNLNDLAGLIANYNPGDKITLTYLRDGIEKTADIKLGALK